MIEQVKSARAILADVLPGESARIDQVLFGALRTLCADLGVREGDEVRCRAGTAGVLVLETAGGNVIALARDWARYIRITLVSPVLEAAS